MGECRGLFWFYGNARGAGLHLLRDVDLEHGEHVEDDVLDTDAEGQAGLLDSGVSALNAAVAVEAVERAGQVDDKAVDAAGIRMRSISDGSVSRVASILSAPAKATPSLSIFLRMEQMRA